MLHRAFVYTGHPQAASESTVFFETFDGCPADEALRRVVGLTWGMPPAAVDHYNAVDELELRRYYDADQVHQRGADRDLCLLQTGDGPDGPVYADPARTMLLVSPRWHARLLAAQELAERRKTDQAIQRQITAMRIGGTRPWPQQVSA